MSDCCVHFSYSLAAPSLQIKGLELKGPYDIIILETEWLNCESLQVVRLLFWLKVARRGPYDAWASQLNS